MFRSIFLAHPASVGEDYFTHQRHAFSFGWRLILAGLACLVHGLVPRLFETRGSRTVRQLHDRMVVNRTQADPAATDGEAIA